MMAAVRAVIALLAATTTQTTSAVLKVDPGKLYEHLNTTDGVRFTSDILFDATAVSKHECGLLCSSQRSCFTFTFVQSQSQCRGHTFLMSALHPSEMAPGAQSYKLVAGFPPGCNYVNGDWTTVQRRIQGGVNFWIGWVRYKAGFGDLCGDFWLGLESLNHLTAWAGTSTLGIDLADWEGGFRRGEWSNFTVGDVITDYTLQAASGKSGNLSDCMSNGVGKKFSTLDRNDVGCANNGKGGNWYSGCMCGNLNGYYYTGSQNPPLDDGGITWYTWKGTYKYSFKYAKMEIKRNV